jgi:hypothetical protein
MGVDRPSGSSRALRLDPHALPVRYAARDSGADGKTRDIELGRERVMLRREVAGIRMTINVLLTEFTGVAMRTLPPDEGEPAAVAITLEHRDPGLSVPLFVAAEGDEAMAEWKSWGRVLGAPLLVDDGDGTFREPFRRIGRLSIGAPTARRRRRASIKRRRPSILLRRKPGRPSAVPTVYRGEREIIARN